MNILIVGCGKVGYFLADQMSRDIHNVTVVDKNADVLRRASDHLDVMCVRGNGIQGSVLREAGVRDVDLIIATTSGDELNMVCCLTAKKLGARYTAARIRDPEYARDISVLKRELEIDMVINPEQATAAEISRILRFAGATHIELFARGRVEMVGFAAGEKDMLAGARLSALRRKHFPNILFCVCQRGDEVFIPSGDTVFASGDHIYAVGEPADLTFFFKKLGRDTSRVKNVMLIGGSRIARYLTDYLIKIGARVKIIESNQDKCQSLLEEYGNATIIHADGTDMDVLESEDMRSCDAFVSLTNRDEDNLMTALVAKQAGVSRVVAKSNRQKYHSVVKSLGLDSVVSPAAITAGQIIHLTRGLQNSQGSIMETLYLLLDDQIEVMEFTVSGDTDYLIVPLRHLRLKKGILIAVIIRHGKIIIPDGSDHIEEGDSLILVCRHIVLTVLNDMFDEE